MLATTEQNLIRAFKVAPAATDDWNRRVLFLEGGKINRTVKNNQLLAAVSLAAYLLKRCPVIASSTMTPGDWVNKYPRTRKMVLFHLTRVEKDWNNNHDDRVDFASAVWMLCRIWQYGYILDGVLADLPVAI